MRILEQICVKILLINCLIGVGVILLLGFGIRWRQAAFLWRIYKRNVQGSNRRKEKEGCYESIAEEGGILMLDGVW